MNNICNKFTNAWMFLLQPLVSKNQIQQRPIETNKDMSVLWGENWLQVKEQSSSDCYCFFFQIAVWVRGDLVFCAETVRNGTGVRFEPALLLPGPLVRIVWCSPTPPSLFLLLHHHLKMPDLAADVGTVHLLLVCAWVVSLSIYKTKKHPHTL